MLPRENYAKRPTYCQNPECDERLPESSMKRRRRYCSDACRSRAYYLRQRQKAT